MSTIDRAAIIEQAVHAIVGREVTYHDVADSVAMVAHEATRDDVRAALPVIAKALLAPLRELHAPVEVEPDNTICGECSFLLPNGRYFGKIIEHPCPTLELLDAIEAEVA